MHKIFLILSIQKPLLVLNASAGSGKTYALVRTYIKLLLSEQEKPYKFSEIIAMTFTNKAALEMKHRIIEKLDELAYPEKHVEFNLDYVDQLALELSVTQKEIHHRSKLILNAILHRYEDFHVMTIDKFNLRLIRSFSLDLDLPNDFEIIMNEDTIIEQVVDNLLNEMGKDGEISKLIFNYAKSRVDEDEKWDVRRDLINFAKVLSKEVNFEIIEELQKSEFTLEGFKLLKNEIKELNASFEEKCKKVFQLFLDSQLVANDLPGAGNTYRPIMRLGEYTSIPKELFTEAFIKNCESPTPPKKNYPDELKSALLRLNDNYLQDLKNYTVLSKYSQNYFNMALLQHISAALENLKKDEHLIRISEFNKMIAALVAEDEAPYIYERLGTRYHHFMLDEFQDTSRLQWLNMIPLFHDSLGNWNENLVVGDPKQSIYRFKNGVADQFVALPELYNPEKDPRIAQKSHFFKEAGEMKVLGSNWRSSEIIVNFNNFIFEKMQLALPDSYKQFYDAVKQHPESKKNGLVEVESYPVKTKLKAIDCMEFILKSIEKAETDGFKRGEICILGRANKDCKVWANALTDLKFKVVSVDSLSVENEPKVKLVMSYLKLRMNPNSQNENKQFAEQYTRVKNKSVEFYRSYFTIKKTESGSEYNLFERERFISENFQSKFEFFFKYESLYELIQLSYQLFNFQELDNPYLHHLSDMVHSYELKNGPDLKLFLQDFASNDSGKAVQLPESDDAVKIMSMHKSKGLEFPVVILPNLDTNFHSTLSEYFIKSDEYTLYSKLSEKSPVDAIKEFTEIEHAQMEMDIVNLYYVAMTRPQERIYIHNPFKTKTFGEVFHNCLLQLKGIEVENDTLYYHSEKGKGRVKKENSLLEEDQFYIPKTSSDNLWFPDIALQDKEDLLLSELLSDEQRFGNQFHLCIAQINAKNEIVNLLNSLEQSGEIETAFKPRLKDALENLFTSNEYNQLFASAENILNEQTFIVSENEQLRPDKIILKQNDTVVIDYKTGLRKKKDLKQVQLYKKLLSEVGYPNVKGFIFYTNENALEQIH